MTCESRLDDQQLTRQVRPRCRFISVYVDHAIDGVLVTDVHTNATWLHLNIIGRSLTRNVSLRIAELMVQETIMSPLSLISEPSMRGHLENMYVDDGASH